MEARTVHPLGDWVLRGGLLRGVAQESRNLRLVGKRGYGLLGLRESESRERDACFSESHLPTRWLSRAGARRYLFDVRARQCWVGSETQAITLVTLIGNTAVCLPTVYGSELSE